MGNSCSIFPLADPNTLNHCNDYYNDGENLEGVPGEYLMKDFCSYYPGQQNVDPQKTYLLFRSQWCDALGSPGEWDVIDINKADFNDCGYNACSGYQIMSKSGCCNGCCAVAGTGNTCIRKQFNGDPIKCCLQDKVCQNPGRGEPQAHTDAPSSCFSDGAKKNTCSPCHRDITSRDETKADGSVFSCDDKGLTPCQELVLEYCSGQDLVSGDTSWIQRWETTDPDLGQPVCIYALKRNLFSEIGCGGADIPITNQSGLCQPVTGPLSSEGVIWGRTLMDSVLERYANDGFVLGSNPGNVGYNTFQDTLYQISCAVPVIIQDGLDKSCSVYTADSVSRNPTIANFCGCYLPNEEYKHYVDFFQVNRECTPMCNRITSIPGVSGDNQPIRCNQSSCIIDDVTINLISSNIGQEGVGISQFCGNCSGTQPGTTGSCNCIISSDVITAVNANIGGINISEQCSSSICSIPNPDPLAKPAQISVPCSQVTNPNDDFNNALNSILFEEARKKQEKIIIIIIVILVLLFLAFLFINLSK